MTVMIGIDPHKATHTAVAIDGCEVELAQLKVRASKRQSAQLLTWAAEFEDRAWAIESAAGSVISSRSNSSPPARPCSMFPRRWRARVRVLGTGRSDKNDPNDARSVAVAALRAPALTAVRAEDHVTVLRVLAKRNLDLARWRNKVCCRLHALVAELVPGGIAKEIVVAQASQLLEGLQPDGAAAAERHRMALELVEDLVHIDIQGRESRRRITAAVAASGTTLTDIFGVGPVIAAMLIGYTGDPRRFATEHRYAAYNGTAPIEFSSAGRKTPSTLPAREPHAEPRDPHGRGHPDPTRAQSRPRLLRPQSRRGQDPTRSAPRAQASHQRRHLPPPHRRRAARRPITRAREDTQGTTRKPAWPALHPDCRLFGQVTPGPDPNLRPTTVPRRGTDLTRAITEHTQHPS